MDATKILTVPKVSRKLLDRYNIAIYDAMENQRIAKKYGVEYDDTNDEKNSTEFLQEFLTFYTDLPEVLTKFSKNCVAHISGWVVKKLINPKNPIVTCEKCREALFQETQTRAEFSDNYLIQAKTRGGLIFPSESVVQICERSERLIRHALNCNKGQPPREQNFPAILCMVVMKDVFQPPYIIFTSLNEHLFDNAIEEFSNHVFNLTKVIIISYIKLRLQEATALVSEAAVGGKMRHFMTRQIIWKSQ